MRPRSQTLALGLLALAACGGPVLIFPGGVKTTRRTAAILRRSRGDAKAPAAPVLREYHGVA